MRLTNLRSNSSAIFSAHDEPLGRDTGLPIVLNPGLDCGGDRQFQIGAGHHDKWIAAAQLQHDFLDAFGRGDSDLNARLFASRQGGSHDARIIQNGINRPRADQQRLKNAFGETRRGEQYLRSSAHTAERSKRA